MTLARTSASLSAVPLGALPVVVLDVESTGLDPFKDRIIEIGGVRLPAANVADADRFQALIDPKTPIPPRASQIHGITDADLDGALDFEAAMRDFAAWAGEAVVVGYAIGFDLGILQAEHLRHGMTWQRPRSLDVRHLVCRLAPDLPAPSLETTAAWLGLEVDERHRALADAMLTARIFVTLVPSLRTHGIVTLAQAERYCSMLPRSAAEQAQAGWASAEGPAPSAHEEAAYARIDSFPYRHRVEDVMNAPPRIVRGSLNLQAAAAHMIEEGVSSLFLEPESPGQPFGIATERDVLRALAADGAGALDHDIGSLGRRPLITVEDREFVYRALASMADGGFRHLGVVDRQGWLVGALSARDLLHQRAEDAARLGDSIEKASNPHELGAIWSRLTAVTRALILEDVDTVAIAAVISRELRALTRRACQFAEQELAQSGDGAAPAPYALMVLGSAGRGESLLAMDQDNALIFDEGGSSLRSKGWFEALGLRVADILHEAGVTYCQGGVMASQASWRHEATEWRQVIRSWVVRSSPKDLLNSDIFFDALGVHGEIGLVDSLIEDAMALARHAPRFLKFLALNASDYTVPIGWFGRLKQKEGRIDLKLHGLMPVIAGARVLAIRHGITARSTRERLNAIKALPNLQPDAVSKLIDAHGLLMRFILGQQLRDLESGKPVSNRVALGELSGFERQQLKWALEQVPLVADLLGVPVLATG